MSSWRKYLSDRTKIDVCVLHIGKTGGTAFKALLKAHAAPAEGPNIKMLPHSASIGRACFMYPNCKVVFFIRDPLSRFVSGFNSRLRQGRPKYFKPWSNSERAAFTRFPTVNALGEAVSSADRSERAAARAALRAIKHIKLDYPHYLGSVGRLEALSHRILFIGEQNALGEDVEHLKPLMGMAPDLTLPGDDVAAHRSPEGLDKNLSPLAEENLKHLLAEDYEIYNWCAAQRREILDRLEK